MINSQEITLPVSLGEALDKLTILDIKLQKIQNAERRRDVETEYNVLMTSLKMYVNAFPYHYRILREVNLAIWEIQDRFHGKDTPAEEGARLCREILLENDRRFRMKAKINTPCVIVVCSSLCIQQASRSFALANVVELPVQVLLR